jgi:hypothetical protein
LINDFYAGNYNAEEEPYLIHNDTGYRYKIHNIPKKFAQKQTLDNHGQEISKMAVLKVLDDNIRYLSFSETKTYCKACAFSEDINGMDMCPVCRKNYKGIQYKTCVDCLPEDKKIAIKEKIEFAKSMQKMHEALGID